MKQKTIDCLKLVDLPLGEVRHVFYDHIVSKYSEKVVMRKLQELKKRGYMECSVSLASGVLTTKGINFLREIETGEPVESTTN